MSHRTLGAWLFGKMPTHGDFVSRGLDQRERDRLDAWLSSGMAAARERLADRFEPCFDAAPSWCFASPDPDGSWSGGALCPSIDAAGRRFPLVVARRAPSSLEAEDSARLCAEVLCDAFEHAYDADALWRAVGEIAAAAGPEATTPGAASAQWWVEDEHGARVETRQGAWPDGLLATMLEGVDA
jgi:type VI secretion system protein ImpM